MLSTAISAPQAAAPAAAGTAAGVAKNTTTPGAPAATPTEGKSAPTAFAPALAALNRAPAEADAALLSADVTGTETDAVPAGTVLAGLPGRAAVQKDPQADSSTVTVDDTASPTQAAVATTPLPWLLPGAVPSGLSLPAENTATPRQTPPSAASAALSAMPPAALPLAARGTPAVNADTAVDPSHASLTLAAVPLARDAKAAATAPTVSAGVTGDGTGNTPVSLVTNAGSALLLNGVQAPSAPAEWAPLKLPAATPDQWAQPLQQALGERLNVQVGHGIENAVIRLDPPMLGSLEIAIRHQGGALQVQLSASNGEVLRQLQGISDSLRQDLGSRQYTDVTVQVSDARSQAGTGDGQGRAPRDEAQPQARPGRALAEADEDYRDGAFTLAQG